MTEAEKDERQQAEPTLNQENSAVDPADKLEVDAPAEALTEEALDLDERDVLIEKLAEETADLKDQLLRTAADLENTRRRAIREKEDAQKYAATNFARDILTVADNMRRALESVSDEAKAALDETMKTLLMGIEMTERELLNVFERHGIKQIDAIGQKFDPNQHNAMFEVEDPSVAPGTVVQQIAVGFQMGDRLLRPAQVGVAKGGQKPAEPAPESDESGQTGPESGNGA